MLNTAKSALFFGLTLGLSPIALALMFADNSDRSESLQASETSLIETVNKEQQETLR